MVRSPITSAGLNKPGGEGVHASVSEAGRGAWDPAASARQGGFVALEGPQPSQSQDD
jgi:hypothetical protein